MKGAADGNPKQMWTLPPNKCLRSQTWNESLEKTINNGKEKQAEMQWAPTLRQSPIMQGILGFPLSVSLSVSFSVCFSLPLSLSIYSSGLQSNCSSTPQLERSPRTTTKSPHAAMKDPACLNKDPMYRS